MIEDLHDAAMLGTSRQPDLRVDTGTEIDGVLASLADGDRERKLLLTAGALAVWQRAGYRPDTAPEPEKAPPDMRPGTADEIAQLLTKMLTRKSQHFSLSALLRLDAPVMTTGFSGDHDDLLPEALQLIAVKGLRLRYYQLPDLLAARTEQLHAALRPVLGARGPWLARLNPVWIWAVDAVPPYADWLWEKGKADYRADLLEVLRRLDPSAAHDRLEERFFSDRFDTQLKLLDALKPTLSIDDEPFLERVLDEAPPGVRLRAATLLATLPRSAASQRICDRADAMLSWKSGKLRAGTLNVTVPDTLDPSWRRDGLEPTTTVPGLNAQERWLVQTVGLVPVRHWIERFHMPLQELIAGLKDGRSTLLLEGWTQAAALLGERDLLPILWDAWWERRKEPVRYLYSLSNMLTPLARAMEPADLGERLARLLLDPPKPDQATGRILEEVPWPWPAATSEAFLEVLRTIAPQLRAGEAPPHPWIFTLGPGARSIGREHIGPALDLLENIQIEDPTLDLWARVLDVIMEKLRLRRQFVEELNR